MALGVDEGAGVTAPERLCAGAGDRSAGGGGLREHRDDLARRADVGGEGDPSPAAGVLDTRVLGQAFPRPERDDHPTALEEDDVVGRSRARRPAERRVEAARALEVADAEGDEADA